MRYLKSYESFKESVVIDLSLFPTEELTESLNIWHDVLLSAISADERNIFDELKLDSDFYDNRLDLDFMSNNIEFINSLSSLGLKKSTVENTDDYQTFINKPCKFMFVYKIEKNELENPEYILFQVWNETLQKWDEVKFYKVNDTSKKFYDKLTSKTIEVVDGDTNYIYQTSNGNDWELQNLESENDIYKRFFRKEELQKLLGDRKVTVSIM